MHIIFYAPHVYIASLQFIMHWLQWTSQLLLTNLYVLALKITDGLLSNATDLGHAVEPYMTNSP